MAVGRGVPVGSDVAAGGLDAIARVLRVTVFVNSSSGFTQQPQVANAASDLLANIFGDAGRHARATVGVAELPLNSSVELDLMVELTSSQDQSGTG